MRGDRDPLLDALMSKSAQLYRAQTLLLDCFALLDDLPDLPEFNNRVHSVQMSTGYFLETVPWEKEPGQPREDAISVGEAPQLGQSS